MVKRKRDGDSLQCEYCGKGFEKSCKYNEHLRTHTGEKPFKCTVCNATFRKDSHLKAHERTHQSDADKGFSCTHCDKKFWTNQHLKRHLKTHESSCICEECGIGFPKQYQLRNHIASQHRQSGTLPHICTHPGCTKSFPTNAKLLRHAQTHQSDRYSCGHEECSHLMFAKWTELQAHIRNQHKPTCPHCGKQFSNRTNLNQHLHLHDQRQVAEKDFHCEVENCNKSFKSQRALNVHVDTTHLNIRPFVCQLCGKSYGYKHLLQRHLQAHKRDEEGETQHTKSPRKSNIEQFTGIAYQKRSIACPYKQLLEVDTLPDCPFRYTRRYDLRRHLASTHNIPFTKQELDYWLDGGIPDSDGEEEENEEEQEHTLDHNHDHHESEPEAQESGNEDDGDTDHFSTREEDDDTSEEEGDEMGDDEED